jgi:hypothetical protein
VDEVATRNVVVARPQQTVAEALAQPGAEGLRQPPAVEDRDGALEPVGVLRRSDVVSASLRAVVLEGQPATALWGDGGLVWLAASAAGWLLAGVLCFRFGDLRAKRQGTLSRY